MPPTYVRLTPHHPRFAATPFCQGGFYGPRTKRFGGLLKRAPTVDSLVQNPAVMRLVHAILEPWCDTVQLNLTQALELHPGAPAQFPQIGSASCRERVCQYV